MNLQFKEMLCPVCRTQTMDGAGGQFGSRIDNVKLRCTECELTLLILPMSAKYRYSISATTEEERVEERIEKAKDAAALALAKEITAIRPTSNTPDPKVEKLLDALNAIHIMMDCKRASNRAEAALSEFFFASHTEQSPLQKS